MLETLSVDVVVEGWVVVTVRQRLLAPPSPTCTGDNATSGDHKWMPTLSTVNRMPTVTSLSILREIINGGAPPGLFIRLAMRQESPSESEDCIHRISSVQTASSHFAQLSAPLGKTGKANSICRYLEFRQLILFYLTATISKACSK